MRFLLDTHIVIWAMVDSKRLSGRARSILLDSENVFYVSSASMPAYAKVPPSPSAFAEATAR